MKLSVRISNDMGNERKKEKESLEQLLTFAQSLLQQLAAAAHDLSTCIQRAAHVKCHPQVNLA